MMEKNEPDSEKLVTRSNASVSRLTRIVQCTFCELTHGLQNIFDHIFDNIEIFDDIIASAQN